MTAKRMTIIDAVTRVGWTDPSGREWTGLALEREQDGLIVAWDGGPARKKIPWDADNFRTLNGETAPDGDEPAESISREITPPAVETATHVATLPVEEIAPFQLQPRAFSDADEAGIRELADDIRKRGQDTPVIVRTAAPHLGKRFELVAGERRLRACQMAGLRYILAIDRGELSDREALAVATAENAHRSDLNPLDVARNIHLLESHDYSQAEIGQLLGGKSQEWVSETKRLHALPGQVQQMVRDGRLSRSHGIRLARFVTEPAALVRVAELAAERGASVRELEKAVPFEDALQPEVAAALRRLARPAPERPAPAPVVEPAPVTETPAAVVGPIATDTTPAAAQDPTPEPEREAPTPTPASAASRPVPSAAEIAADRAAARTGQTTASTKPGALKSAEEKVAEKAAATPAGPTSVTTIIPGPLHQRFSSLGGYAIPAITTWCELAEMAKASNLEPRDALGYLGRFLGWCREIGRAPDVVLTDLEGEGSAPETADLQEASRG